PLHTASRTHTPLHVHYFIILRQPPHSPLFPYTTLFRSKQLRVAAVYGGVPVAAQAKRAKSAHVLIATPGRLEDLNVRRLRALCLDRKSTRLNSSHVKISYAVFCLKKKNIHPYPPGMNPS